MTPAKRCLWTPEDDEILLAMKAKGATQREIAELLGGRTGKQVWNRWKWLTRPEDQRPLAMKCLPGTNTKAVVNEFARGWPKIDRKKEWPIGCFNGQDVSPETLRREFSGTPRRLHAPVMHTVGGVARYG
jgi:hypothetical protein